MVSASARAVCRTIFLTKRVYSSITHIRSGGGGDRALFSSPLDRLL